MKINKIIASLTSVFALFVFAVVTYAATTVVVTGNTSAGENQPGWMFGRDLSTSTPFEFNEDQASIGDGSLYVSPIGANASDKFIAENFINTPIASISSISYDFMIAGNGDANDEEQFYMNVYANFGVSDDLKFYDCRYNVIPTTGSIAGFTTATFNPTQAYPVTTRTGGSASPFTCPAVPADMNTLSDGSNIRVFALNVGDTSTSDQGLGGYLDKVVVSTTSDVTTYDLEEASESCDDNKVLENGICIRCDGGGICEVTNITPTTTPTVTPTPTSTVNPTSTPTPGTGGSSSNTTSVTEPKKEVLGATSLGKTGAFEKNLANLFAISAIAFLALSGATAFVKKS